MRGISLLWWHAWAIASVALFLADVRFLGLSLVGLIFLFFFDILYTLGGDDE